MSKTKIETALDTLRWCSEYIERDRKERFTAGDYRAGGAAHLLGWIKEARERLMETDVIVATRLDGSPLDPSNDALAYLRSKFEAMKGTLFILPGSGQHHTYILKDDVLAWLEQAEKLHTVATNLPEPEELPRTRRMSREEMGKLCDAMGLEHKDGVLPVDPIYAALPFVSVSSPKYHYDRLLTPPPPGPSSRSVIEGAVDPVAQNQAYLARERDPATMGSRVVKGIDLERRTGIERRQPAICMEFMGHQPERREVDRRARVPAPVKAAMNPTYEETWEQRRQRLMTPRDRAVELLEKALALSKQLGDLIAERDQLLKEKS